MRIPITIFLLFLLTPLHLRAQKFVNIEAVAKKDKVRISYDLLAEPYIGLTLQDLTQEEKNKRQNDGDGWVKVVGIRPQSPAEKAGFAIEDIIHNAGSNRISSAGQIKDILNTRLPGEKISFLVTRGKEKLLLEPVLSQNPIHYKVEVYSSFDNFSQPLKLLEGDVGGSIQAGINKTIIWMGMEELGSYTGDLQFELQGFKQDPTKSFLGSPSVAENSLNEIKVLTPAAGSKLKNGKNYSISWTGGNPQDKLDIELYKNQRVIATLAWNIPNKKTINWKISKNLNPGKNYVIKIVNSESNSILGTSQAFTVKKGNTVQNILILAATVAALIVVQTQL